MKYSVVIRSQAESDFIAAARWYESQSRGLGTEFLRAVEVCIASIGTNPAMFAVVYKNLRRALLRKFPYGIFFLIKQQTVVVIACLHGRQSLVRLNRRK